MDNSDRNSSPDKKPKLIFAPHYLGSLLYLEKLIPYLSGKYEILFLFLPKSTDPQIQEMAEYCGKKGRAYLAIPRKRFRGLLKYIPFLEPFANFLHYRQGVMKLLKDKSVKKIISSTDLNYYFNYLFGQANRKGIDTMVVQWAVTNVHDLTKKSKVKPNFVKTIYWKMVNFTLTAFFGPYFGSAGILGAGLEKKFGVINEQAYAMFKAAGVDEKKMSVIGYLTFYKAETAWHKFQSDPGWRKQLADKYRVNTSKINIVVFTTPFNLKDIHEFSDQEQTEYYKKIIRAIREVFTTAEADILLKIHPAENRKTYEPLAAFKTTFYNKTEIANEELVCLADLFLAHSSTVNYIPIIMGKDAIFLNFINWPIIDEHKEYFAIKHFVSDFAEFKKMLSDFKAGKLEKQYYEKNKVATPHSLERIINWIG